MAKSSTSFKPGQKVPGSGRPKGTPNKKTLEFQAMLERHNFDPGEEYVLLYKEQMRIFHDRKKNKRNQAGALEALSDAGHTLNNICQFVYPKKKAIEHTGEVGIKTFADFMAAAQGKK